MHVAVNAYFWNRPNSGSGQYTRCLVATLHQMVSDLQITLVYPLVAGASGLEGVPEGVQVLAVLYVQGMWVRCGLNSKGSRGHVRPSVPI